MKIITNTYNPSEIDGFSYAFVDLDADLARLILQRRDTFKRIRGTGYDPESVLECMEYRDYSAMFLSGVPDGTLLENTDDGGDFDEVDLFREDFENYVERTDCDRMCITDRAVYWTAYSHHSDRSLTIETNQIDYETVELAAGVEVKEQQSPQ